MKVNLHYENACATANHVPENRDVLGWVESTLNNIEQDNKGRGDDSVSLSVRVVDENEIADLNQRYRMKAGPTNVLSFPFEDPPGVESDELGDVIICAPVVQREAAEQGKSETAHWAHMVVHGVLHLCGYDHVDDADADVMESRETAILTGLGFPAPYAN